MNGRGGPPEPGDDELLPDPVDSRRARYGYALAAVLLVAAVLAGFWIHHDDGAPTAARTPAPTGTPSERQVVAPAPDDSTGPVVLPPTRSLPDVGDVQLFARAANAVVEIDFAAGWIVATPIPALRSTGPVSFGVTGGGAYVRPLDRVPGYFVPDGGPAQELTGTLADGSLLPGPDPGSFWMPLFKHNRLTGLWYVSIASSARGPVLHVPARMGNIWRAPEPDGTGYVLVSGAGGTFDLRPDGARRLPVNLLSGTLLAAGGDRLLAAACPAPHRPSCPATLVRLPGGQLVKRIGSLAVTAALHAGAISPDGSTAMIYQPPAPGQLELRLLDLRTGRFRGSPVTVDPQAQPGSAVFSPDGRWAFVVSAGGTLTVIDVRTGAAQQVRAGLPYLYQLAARSDRRRHQYKTVPMQLQGYSEDGLGTP